MIGMIERKLLGALLQLSDEDGIVKGKTLRTIAERMGYKTVGGAITLSLKSLEFNNYIKVEREDNVQHTYKITVLI
jgi:hypothetical protein